MKTFNTTIISNELVSLNTYKISLKLNDKDVIKPGNFFMLDTKKLDSILKRPIAVYDYDEKENIITFIYVVVGSGTNFMSKLENGEQLDILGPFGNSFEELENENILLIGGGAGLFPLYFYAKRFDSKNKITFIAGARNKEQLGFYPEFEKLNIKNITYTDDGSLGKQGLVTNDLMQIIEEVKPSYIFCCGPNIMMKSVHDLTKHLNIKTYVSLEARMACGFGACMGCSCKTISGMKKICKNGPVFDAKEIFYE
ncbi:MAG: dihydroorotate dehydrogenase electron transfer subunit [Mycoplasma sp.]